MVNPTTAVNSHHLAYGAVLGTALHFTPIPYAGLLGTSLIAPLVFYASGRRINPFRVLRDVFKSYGGFLGDAASEFAVETYNDTLKVSAGLLNAPALAEALKAARAEEVEIDETWIRHLVTIQPTSQRAVSWGLLGNPGDGKTYLANQLFMARLEQVPDGDVYLFDFKNQPHKYLDILTSPARYITEPNQLVDLLAVLAKRCRTPDCKPFYLFIDELNNALGDMSEKNREKAIKALGVIRKSGGERNCLFTFTTHEINQADLHLPVANMKAFPWVILQRFAEDGHDINNIGISGTVGQQFEALVAEMGDIELEDDSRLGILKSGNKMRLIAVPDRGDLTTSVTVVCEEDEDTERVRSFLERYLTKRVQWAELSNTALIANDDFQTLFQEHFGRRLTKDKNRTPEKIFYALLREKTPGEE